MKYTIKEEKQVGQMTRYQVDKMTLKQLYIAAEYEKFSVSDLIERAQQIANLDEIKTFVEYINTFEAIPRIGSWYTSESTVKWQ